MLRACRPLVVLGAAALVGAAFGMLSCKLGTEGLGPPQADGSIGDAPSFDSPFDSPQEASEDDAPPDGGVDAMALCLSRCTLEGGICEPTGNGGVQCSVYCNTADPCVSVACPAHAAGVSTARSRAAARSCVVAAAIAATSPAAEPTARWSARSPARARTPSTASPRAAATSSASPPTRAWVPFTAQRRRRPSPAINPARARRTSPAEERPAA
jgi:hypothetical protein